MDDRLYNKIIRAVDKDIKNIIQEQFNVGNMDLRNKNMHKSNIFNKATVDPFLVYDKMTNIKNKGHVEEYEIKQLNDYVAVVKAESRRKLINIIEFYTSDYLQDSLNWVDVSGITDMSNLFQYSMSEDNCRYTGDISKWDVSNVTNMSYMFAETQFSSDISMWDVSNVSYMSYMFFSTSFNGDISDWDVNNVNEMQSMFSYSEFNGDISQWDVSNVINMKRMFAYSKFNGDISGWNVSNVTDMREMFKKSYFNKDISGWNVQKVTDYFNIFEDCSIPEKYKPVKHITLN